MAKTRARPLSPHLEVYEWQPNMAVSILHRATGLGMALVGGIVLVWWLSAAASGEGAYMQFLGLIGSPLGLLVLIGLTWSFFQHLCSGLRHLFMDTGAGYDPAFSRKTATVTFIASTLLTLAVWVYVLAL